MERPWFLDEELWAELLKIVMTIAVALGGLYLLVQFVKWAW